MRIVWLGLACLLAACGTANSLETAADRDERWAETRAKLGDGDGARWLYERAASERARAELLRHHRGGPFWADVTLH